MKKLIVGLVAVAAVMALRPVVKRHVVQKMREHCEQMMGRFAGRRETTEREAMDPEVMRQKMREHCGPMAAQQEALSEPVAIA